MRYIANSSGYLQEVSFGATITCGGTGCKEYTGSVPSGYTSLENWYCQEAEKLYRWKIVSGQLTLDSSATAPAEKTAAPCETGTWTATVNAGTITTQKCTYQKVGNMCTISFFIQGTGLAADVATNFYIKGAPYAPATGATWYGGGGHVQGLWDTSDATRTFTGFIIQSSNRRIYGRTKADGTTDNGYIRIGNGTATFYLSGTITYPVA